MRKDRQEIIKEYKNGSTYKEICDKFDVGKSEIFYILKGVSKRLSKFDKGDVAHIQKRYNDGERLKDLAIEFNYKLSTIKTYIKTKPRLPKRNAELIRQQNVFYVNKRRKKIKQKAIQYKGGKCSRCGYDKCAGALDFHHIEPSLKSFSISHEGHTKAWLKVKDELDKCILVCKNCHAEIHYELQIQKENLKYKPE